MTLATTGINILSTAQTSNIVSKPVAEIFTDFHYIIHDTTRTNGFSLNRAHLGYQYAPGGKISSRIIVNVGTPVDLPPGSTARRYAFFREASISYNDEKFTINFGIVNTKIFEFQQKFWSKRYIATEYQGLLGYGTVADLGMVAEYRVNRYVTADLSILNGEGYSNIQIDNSLKTGFGITFQTEKQFAVRFFGDIMRLPGVTQATLIAFAGKKAEHYSLGLEASYKSNLDRIPGHDSWGYSGTGAVILSEKSELFFRYDYSTSNVAAGEGEQWNLEKDGIFTIIGYQHTFNQFFRAALNIQSTAPQSSGRENTHAVFLSLHFKY